MAPSHSTSRRSPARAVPVVFLVIALVSAGLLSMQRAHADTNPLANDSFARTASVGWGSAPRGGRYTVAADKATKLSVSSGRGHVRSLGRSKAVTTTLRSVTGRDVDIRGTFVLPGKAPVVYHAYRSRVQTDGSAYLGRIDVLRNGDIDLTVSRIRKDDVEVTLARKRLSVRAGTNTAITSEYQFTGTSPVVIKGRAWMAGRTEPAWQISTVDASASRIGSPGHIGTWVYSSGSNRSAISIDEDSLVATSTSSAPAISTPTARPTPPPLPTPTAPPAPVATTGRGSVAVGSSDYPVPARALFVSPAGNDTASGSRSSPLRTVAAAVSKAVSGDTIVLRAGTYNESVSIPEYKTSLTVQSYPHEAVWFDGSKPVTSWTRTGSTWTTYGWDHFFSHDLDGITDNPTFVNTKSFPLAARADMVFIDGKQMKQVGAATAVSAGTFAVDENAETITIGSDPTGHELRASNQMQAIYAKSAGAILEGFGIRRYATPYNVRGAIRLGGDHETARNLVIEDSATTGVNFEADGITLDHLTVTRSGMQGIGGNSAYGSALTGSVITFANTEHFNEAPVSGGVKITRSRDVTVSDNDFKDNISFGLWLDESCYDARVVNNTVAGNTGHGVEIELSAHSIVADNVVTDNGKSGIRLLDTSDTQVFNNSIGDNGVFGVQLSQDERRESDLSVAGHDPRRPRPDPTFSWLTQNDVIANNAFGSGGAFQIYALDNWTGIPVDAWNLTIDGNLFNDPPTGSQTTMVAWGASDKVTLQRFNDVASLSRAKGATWKNAETASVAPLAGMAAAITTATATALPLPPDVAAAVGRPTGTRHVGTF